MGAGVAQQRIGNYQVLEKIASGGQGAVYQSSEIRSAYAHFRPEEDH